MKKILTLIFVFCAIPALGAEMVFPEIGVMQNHDIQSIDDQIFRREVISDVKGVKEQKEEFEKMPSQQPLVQKMINNTNSEFVEENGKIKIKYIY